MSEINVRDLQCENCRKFSHCNNNELVCISKFQQLKTENEKLKRLIAKQKNAKIQLSKLKDNQYKEFCDMKQCLDEIEEIARTLGNQNDVKHRLNDKDIQKLLKIDDDLLSSEEIMRKYILQLIKQAKEGRE